MSTYKNSRKKSFLSQFPLDAITIEESDLKRRCKFNFSYFDSSQTAGQDLLSWDEDHLQKFWQKIIYFSGSIINLVGFC